MITINNYTRGNEVHIDELVDLEIYAEVLGADEEVSYSIDSLGMEGLGNCTVWLDLDTDTQDLLTATAQQVGKGYYKTIPQLLHEVEDRYVQIVDGVDNDRELAHKLEYTEGYEEILYSVLNCTAEAYSSLSSYIRTDDIASTLDTEWSVQYVGGKGYIFN